MADYNFKDLNALIGEEAKNNDNYYRDATHITNVDSEITSGQKDSISVKLATWIRQKKYGIDVREALARFIEWMSVLFNKNLAISDSAKDKADKVEVDLATLEARYNAQISANTNIDEVIDARVAVDGSTNTTLSERLKTIGERINEGVDMEDLITTDNYEVEGGILDKFKSELAPFKNDIDTSKFCIGVGNDFHYDTMTNYKFCGGSETTLNHLQNLMFCTDKLNLAVLNGDLVDSDNNVPIETAKHFLEDFATVAFTAAQSDVFMQIGNHDSSYIRDDHTEGNVLSNAQLAEILGYNQKYFNEERPYGKGYFYKDYPDAKFRVIGLNTSEVPEVVADDGTMKYSPFITSAVSQEQVSWLTSEALILPDPDYHVIVFAHIMPVGVYGATTGSTYPNTACLLPILKAFKTGSAGTYSAGSKDFLVEGNYDFSQQGTGNLIGYFFGHVHKDSISVVDGINFVSTTCSLPQGESSMEEPRWSDWENSYVADAWDILEIDRLARIVKIKRFGWKSSTIRSISY